jgi:hypothetical protein
MKWKAPIPRWLFVLLLLLAALMAIRAAGIGATARCRDGSYSWSRHHSGTCSWHKGVAEWFR